MSPSLSGVEAWRVDDRLEPGSYIAKATAPERKKSSGSNEQVQVDWRVVTGDWQGAEQRDWITFTDASLGNVAQVLEACGVATPDIEFSDYGAMADWVAEQLAKGPVVEMVVRNDTWVDREGKERTGPKIKGYRRPDEGDVPSDASAFNGTPKTASSEPDPPF